MEVAQQRRQRLHLPGLLQVVGQPLEIVAVVEAFRPGRVGLLAGGQQGLGLAQPVVIDLHQPGVQRRHLLACAPADVIGQPIVQHQPAAPILLGQGARHQRGDGRIGFERAHPLRAPPSVQGGGRDGRIGRKHGQLQVALAHLLAQFVQADLNRLQQAGVGVIAHAAAQAR